ncbi:MAG TPA: sensor histidine kinase [Ktedonobacterales bacterium]
MKSQSMMQSRTLATTGEPASRWWSALGIGLSSGIMLALALWALVHPSLPTPVAPPGARVLLFIATGTIALAVRYVRERFVARGDASDVLPDPLYALYLATIILVGLPPAVLLALITPVIAGVPDVVRQPRLLAIVLYDSASAGLITFISGLVYVLTSQALMRQLGALHAHSAASVVAVVVMLLGIGLSRALGNETPGDLRSFLGELSRRYVSPALRFQLLLLSIGPLLPLAEALDDVEAEFAWILFLVPLCAVYYLALLSARLQQRTDELQVTVSQLSASRRRQAELSDYAALVTRAQEDERRRLARELHDDTAQALIALSRGLDALAKGREGSSSVGSTARYVTDLSELTKRTLDGVRRACQDLRPSVLDDLGLPAALESLAHSITQRGLPCDFSLVGDALTAAPEVEVTLYRIAQEALSNARQHAQARAAALDIIYAPQGITLRITDDGCGFDYERLIREYGASTEDTQELRSGLGLMGMRERAALIHATLDVRSAQGAGTVVTLIAPLSALARIEH